MSVQSQDWKYHYRKAEELVSKSYGPNTSTDEKDQIIARAQVHATLATLRTHTELPEVFG